MGNFLTSSSIGKKLVMGITGCFLVLFLFFHAAMNVTAIFSADAYNVICEFLGSNWYAVAGTVVLVAGILLHFIYSAILTLQNRRARGSIRYDKSVREKGVSWASKNMFIIGAVVGIGLLIHFYQFWGQMMLVELLGNHVNAHSLSPTDGAGLIQVIFSDPINLVLYLVWFVAIWFHLTHGMWSMLQTVGWANDTWYPRIKVIGYVLATVVMAAFAAVAIFFYLQSIGCAICI